MVARTLTSAGALLLLLALPATGAAHVSQRCGGGGGVFPTQDELDEPGPSVGVGFSCDVGRRFGFGGDLEYEVSDEPGQSRLLGTGRMLVIGEQGGGAFVLRGHAGMANIVEVGDRLVAPLPPDISGTTFSWDATGPTAGGSLRAMADLGDGMLGFIEGGVRTAFLNVRDRWEAGERVDRESIFVTSYSLTARLGVRF